jgi:2-hydroxy-6-oxonona-2,4-dienedioate hydrolase
VTTDEQRYREAERRLWASVDLRPSERFVSLRTVGTQVRVQEVGAGEPVLFVHGATTCGTSWASLVAALPGHRCLLLDRPGCGLSEALPRQARDLGAFKALVDSLVVDVLDALDLPQVDLVGTSLGGYVALRAAAAHPERIRRLAIVAAPIGAPIPSLPMPMRLAAVPGLGRAMASMPPPRRAVVSMLRQVGLRRAIDEGHMGATEIDWYHSLLRDTPTMRNEVATAGGSAMHPIRGLDPGLLLDDELLGRISAPTLFLWGADDVFGGEATARAFAARVPGAELQLLDGLGHAPWMDDTEAVAGPLRAFLS